MGLFWKSKVNSDWKSLVDVAEKKVKPMLEETITMLFMPDNIDPQKFKANHMIATARARSVAESRARLYGEEDLLKYATKSIDKCVGLLDKPLGFPNWFAAAYPDVIEWQKELSDDDLEKMIEGFDQNDLFNEDHQFKTKYLRIFVDSYLKKHKLECAK